MKRILITGGLSLFSLLSVLALSSSSTEGVREGMSTQQVSSIMGEPDIVLSSQDKKNIVVWKYTINTIVSFVDGKVESVYKAHKSQN